MHVVARLAVLGLVLASLPGLARAAEAPPPAAPAYCTERPSNARKISGDALELGCTDFTYVPVRLRDAVCAPLGEAKAASARHVARELIEAEPFWVFPCGQDAEGTRLVRVWTKKGWLGEVLLAAHLARRPPPAPMVAAPEAKAPFDGGRSTPPRAPAFAARLEEAGEAFQATQAGGATVPVTLFDAEVAGSAAAVLAKAAPDATVWVFPTGPAKPGAPQPVRVWTGEGFLADLLVAAGAARYREDPAKAGVEGSADAAGTTKTSVRLRPPREKEPTGPDRFDWQPVSVVARPNTTQWVVGWVAVSDKTVLSEVFEITQPLCRMTWNQAPCRPGFRVSGGVYAVSEKSPDATAGKAVETFKGESGSRYLRIPPGRYFIRISGSVELNVTLEQAFPKTLPEQ